MLPKVDYLILTLNNEGNDNFLDKSKIALLTNNCCVVNVSRSKILDEEFLLYSIKNKMYSYSLQYAKFLTWFLQ